MYQPGDIIQAKYRIISILGKGGTAITYEAADTTQENLTVAIKVLSLKQAQDWKIVELFEREVKVLKSLNHPQIPNYLDSFTIDTDADRQFFLVQELISGKSLATLIEQGWRFQEEEVKNIAQKILEILTYLHSFRPPIIHRDIKPQNIIRTDEGEIYLVDLGAVQDVYRHTVARGATFVGTIDYISPEQIRGQASFASDLYSLGCTLLYLLIRRSPSELPVKRMKIDFRSSLDISKQFADWLDTILEPALEDRFRSTESALRHLSETENSIVSAKPPKGSLIKLKKNHSSLQIDVVVSNTIRPEILLLAFLILFISFPFWLNNRVDDDLFHVIMLIQMFFYGIYIANPLLGKIVVTKLIINKHDFILEHDYKILKRFLKGNTKEINKIYLDKQFNIMTKDYEKYCCISEGAKKYKFGKYLSEPEQKWVIKQIKIFLSEIYPERFGQKQNNKWLSKLFNLD